MAKTKYTYADGVKPDPANHPCCSFCGEKLKPHYEKRNMGVTLEDGKYYPVDITDWVWGVWPEPYNYETNKIVFYHVERYKLLGYGYNPHIDYDLFCTSRCGYKYAVNIDTSWPNWRHENCNK